MTDPKSEDWSPERERDEDPIVFQKKYMEFAQDFLGRIEKLKAPSGEVKPDEAPSLPRLAVAYQPPSRKDTLTRLRALWADVVFVFADAPSEIRLMVFQHLIHMRFQEDDPDPGQPQKGGETCGMA